MLQACTSCAALTYMEHNTSTVTDKNDYGTNALQLLHVVSETSTMRQNRHDANMPTTVS